MSLRNRTLTVRRMAGGEYSSTTGLWTSQVESSTFEIECSVQPLGPRQMQALPEGRRNRQSWEIWTDTTLNTVESQNPDRIVIDGSDFEVYSVSPWKNDVLPHYEIVVQKMDEVNP